MQIPAKAHYAAIAMLVLAERYRDEELISARTIAAEHAVPSQFLAQILQQLRSANLITSTRGASGGFKLQRAPELITLAEIVDAVCGTQCSPIARKDASNLNRVMLQVWSEQTQQQREQLEQLTLRDLLDRSAAEHAAMFYI
jgi:Rrf2 family protein